MLNLVSLGPSKTLSSISLKTVDVRTTMAFRNAIGFPIPESVRILSENKNTRN